MRNFLLGVCIGVLIMVIFCAVALAFAKDKKTQLPFTVATSLNKKTFTIGEPIRYSITVSSEPGVDVEFLGIAENGKAGVLELKDSSVSPGWFLGKKGITARYVFNAYSLGNVSLPEVTLHYKKANDKKWSKHLILAQAIEIKSVISDPSKEVEIRDIEPPIKTSKMKYLIVLFLGVFVAAAIFLYRKYFLIDKTAGGKIRQRSAHELAYEQLEALQKKNLVGAGKLKEYFSEISGIVRKYLENRFDFHAPEMTTEEFMANVKESSQLIKAHKDSLKEFLVSCDLVKFAKYTPDDAEISVVYLSAKKFIDATKEEVSVDIT